MGSQFQTDTLPDFWAFLTSTFCGFYTVQFRQNYRSCIL